MKHTFFKVGTTTNFKLKKGTEYLSVSFMLGAKEKNFFELEYKRRMKQAKEAAEARGYDWHRMVMFQVRVADGRTKYVPKGAKVYTLSFAPFSGVK